jgi:hypothetical protein
MDNGIDNEGDGAADNDGDNGYGATDDDVDKDGDGDGATDKDGDSDGATDEDDDDDDNGDNNSNCVAADVDDDEDIDDSNLPPCVGKRNDSYDETKTEEEEMVADSVAIHTTIKQITGRGGGTSQHAKVDLKPLIVSVIPIYSLSDTISLFCFLLFILINKLITFNAS